ncbi:hypothetical protein [Bradyrhizobium sp. 2TAF24]|uniref:hypothetical protein n=1 Tax=Bradyrhizobium sp. 2TAF24 TaxID=3233011 RepID=UPI003F8ED200
MPLKEFDDRLIVEDIEAAVKSPQVRGILKALLIGLMMLFSVSTLNGSTWKAIAAGAVFFLVGSFNTWRRYLELPVFVIFCIATLYLCNNHILQDVVSAIAHIRQLITE